MNSTSPKAKKIGHELGLIKSNVGREIAALKNAVSKHHHHHHRRLKSPASSSSTSSISIRKASIESIKSATKWNEKAAEISFDDIKFSTIIDDEKEYGDVSRPSKEIDGSSGVNCDVAQ
jgi:hypothetical protein